MYKPKAGFTVIMSLSREIPLVKMLHSGYLELQHMSKATGFC